MSSLIAVSGLLLYVFSNYADAFSFLHGTRLRSSKIVFMSGGENHFDYLVIGGGSGGVASARRAAGYGAKVGIFEKTAFGGTCVNVGCVPKKVMWNAASVNEILAHDAKQFGFEIEGYKFNWNQLKTQRDTYIKRLNGIYTKMIGSNGITIIDELASFTGPKELKAGDNTYTADHILIAVGGKPFFPSIPGVEHCISSDGFFQLDTQPESVAVIGGGYIGVELAGVFHALGTKTSLMTRAATPLTGFDDLIVSTLVMEMFKQGMTYCPNTSPVEFVKRDDGKIMIKTSDKGVDNEYGPFDQVVMATGRVPLTEPLNLEKAGVKTFKKGYIEADDYQQTSTQGVYALGDVCGKVELTPMAIAAGRRLADRLFGGMPDAKADYSLVPTVVFAHPVIGTVGLTEAQAVDKYGVDMIRTYTSTFTNLWYGPWTMEPDEKPKTAYKLITLLPEEKVLGMHMIGMGSDEALQGFGVAIKMGCTKWDLDSCVAIHPTAAEEMVTMGPWGMSPAPKKVV